LKAYFEAQSKEARIAELEAQLAAATAAPQPIAAPTTTHPAAALAPHLGIEASKIQIKAEGGAMPKSSTLSALEAISESASAELKDAVYRLCDNANVSTATTAELIQLIFTVAGHGLNAPPTVLGSAPLASVIESNALQISATTGALNILELGQKFPTLNRKPVLANLMPVKRFDEATTAGPDLKRLVHDGRGEGLPPSTYDNDVRTYVISHETSLHLKLRLKAQVRILDAFIATLPHFCKHGSLHASEHSTLLANLTKLAHTPTVTMEIFGSPTPTSYLLSLLHANMHAGSNAIAEILRIQRDRDNIRDHLNVGAVLSQFVLGSGEAPTAAFSRLTSLAKNLPPLAHGTGINFSNFGLATYDDEFGTHFKCLHPDSIANFVLMSLYIRSKDQRFRDVRTVLTDALYA
jgi:hypothetical protein